MLLIDGVKYELWTPPSEDEFEQVAKEHTQEIFGEQSIYIDRKQKLKSLSGIGSIPDGYVIILGTVPQWHIVEVELSSHPLDQHIVAQVSRFITGIKNPNTQRDIVGAMYDEITMDGYLKFKVEEAIKPTEIYKYLSDLISKPPILTIIIERDTEGLREAISTLAHSGIKVVEFQTFTREKAGLEVHAHLFEPLYKSIKQEQGSKIKDIKAQTYNEKTTKSEIQVQVTPAALKYGLIPLPMKYRHLFPGFNESFILITDNGEIKTHVTGAPAGTPVGDRDGGNRIQTNLKPWYKNHPNLRSGDELIIKIIDPLKKYRLEIVK